MARRKKISGTTTKPGKVSTSPVARVAADRVEGRHGGKKPLVKGAQTEVERNALRGPSRAGRSSVRQIGPSAIREAGSGGTSSVRVVGEGMLADDQAARRELAGGAPGRRQESSVKSVGPSDIEYQRLTERTPSPSYRTLVDKNRPKPAGRPISGVRLLKSGVGRVHPWSVFAGQPGSKRGGITGVGPSSSEQTLINGRRRAFRPEPFPPDLVTPSRSVVPGS